MNLLSKPIKEISLVTSEGAATYFVGQDVNGSIVKSITVYSINFDGDPYEHYCGFNELGQLIFSINHNCPCLVKWDSES